VKIRIKRANTVTAEAKGMAMAPHYVLCRLYDYLDELLQQNKWNAEKCQHES
jgi:hypothetical protein